MTGVKEYLLRGSSWALLGKFATVFLNLLLMSILTRALPPAEMGLYFLAFNLATFFSIIGRGGLENTLLRFIAQTNEPSQSARLKSVLIKGSVLVLATILLTFLLAIISIPWLSNNLFHSERLTSITYLIAIWSALLAMQFVTGEVFRGFQEIKKAIWFGGLLTAIISATVLSLGHWLDLSLFLATTITILILAIVASNSLALFSLYHKTKPLEQGKTNNISYKELINHSWPLLINALTLFLLSQSDLWLLGTFASEKEVAIYGAASRLVLLTAMSLAIVNAVVPPLIARMHIQNDMHRLENVLRTVATLAAIPALFVLALFIFFSESIMTIIYGEYYRAGSTVLLILCIGQIVNVLVGSCGYTLIMTGHRNITLLISIFCTFIAMGLGTILVAQYGVIGLASVYSFAIGFQQILMWLFVRLRCGIWTHIGVQYMKLSILKKI